MEWGEYDDAEPLLLQCLEIAERDQLQPLRIAPRTPERAQAPAPQRQRPPARFSADHLPADSPLRVILADFNTPDTEAKDAAMGTEQAKAVAEILEMLAKDFSHAGKKILVCFVVALLLVCCCYCCCASLCPLSITF